MKLLIPGPPFGAPERYLATVSASPVQPHASSPAELEERLAAERLGEPHLIFRDADGRQVIATLEGSASQLTIGRAAGCDVPLTWDPSASRGHAQLERVADTWIVVDDGLSRHGTFVNGARLRGRRRLDDGDMLKIGSTLLLFRAPREDFEETAPPDEGAEGAHISPAQRRVLVALCRPYLAGEAAATPATNKQIAEELVLSEHSVKTHLRALCEVLGVGQLPRNVKRARLVQRALDAGLVSRQDLNA